MDTSKLTPNEIAESWKGLFCFKKENGTIMGLRSPQIGALHSMLAHVEDGEERAIVVMPTGTGKTETMLAFLIANMCKKVFVVVPSDALRSQIAKKFKDLGLLPKLGIVPQDINNANSTSKCKITKCFCKSTPLVLRNSISFLVSH